MYSPQKSTVVQLIIALGLVFVSVMFFKYASAVYKDYKTNQRIIDLKQDIISLETQNAVLTEDLEYFDTSAYKEIIAKRELNLRRPGEKVFIIKQNQSQEDLSEEYDYSKVVYVPIYKKWWNVFFGDQ